MPATRSRSWGVLDEREGGTLQKVKPIVENLESVQLVS